MSIVRYAYDSESDCGYIRLGDGDVARTESVTASLHVDRDGSGEIAGIEVLAVTDPSWIPQVTDLLAGSVPDASLVSARLRELVATGHQGTETERSTLTTGPEAGGTNGDMQVA